SKSDGAEPERVFPASALIGATQIPGQSSREDARGLRFATDMESKIHRKDADLPEPAAFWASAQDQRPISEVHGQKPPATAIPFLAASIVRYETAPSAPFPHQSGYPDSCGHGNGTASPAGARLQTSRPARPGYPRAGSATS